MTESAYSLPIMETVKAAWAKVHGTKKSVWAVILIFFLVQIVIGVLNSLGAKVLFGLINSLVQIIAAGSLVYLGIRRAQDMPVSYKMIKDILNIRMVLYLIGIQILQVIIFIPAGILVGIGTYFVYGQPEPSGMMELLAAVFYLVAAVLFIFLGVRMWIGYAAVLDKKLNPWEAIKLSFKATRENVWNLIGLYIINLFIVFVCALTLGIGLIWGIPWLLIIYGEAYKRLVSRQDIRPVG